MSKGIAERSTETVSDPTTRSIRGHRVVVIGASSGIGLATAELMSRAGAELVLANRDETRLREVAKGLPGNASTHRLDVSREADVAAFFEKIGGFDHLVVPAAGSALGTLADSATESIRALVDSKFWGQTFAVKYGARLIAKKGSITLFSGTVTGKPLPGTSAFAAVGSAIEAASRVWALEYAPIRINTIVPGIIDTPIWGSLLGESGRAKHLDGTARVLPVGRVGLPGDVAKAVAFLIDSPFVTGTTLVVDGGHRLV